jgi:hypothetical protein
MVNGWLKSAIRGVDDAPASSTATNERIFATKSALTSKGQCGPGRSEVVLDQAILGLLINGRQRLPWGIKE